MSGKRKPAERDERGSHPPPGIQNALPFWGIAQTGSELSRFML